MKNMILLFFVCIFFNQTISSQKNNSEGITLLDWMIGKWDITAILTDSKGSSTKESGINNCTWQLGKRVIRCDLDIRTDQSTDPKVPKFRSIITYFAYNKTKKHYKVTWIRSSGENTSVVFKKKNDSILNSTFTYKPPSLGFNMIIDFSLTKINNNKFIDLEILNKEDGSFSERYESIATRIK